VYQEEFEPSPVSLSAGYKSNALPTMPQIHLKRRRRTRTQEEEEE